MVKKSKLKSLPHFESEKETDDWFQKADLTDYFSGDEFHKARFARLEKKLINDAYDKALESQPVTLRLPQELVQKLKLAAIKQGIAYQTLARILLQRNVNKLL
jgi:predicted DNA binding CopG/RHH family protein